MYRTLQLLRYVLELIKFQVSYLLVLKDYT